MPKDVPLGTSSLTITSSLIGGTARRREHARVHRRCHSGCSPAIGGGLILGAGVGYYAGTRLHVKPGDAAVINSGALWGTRGRRAVPRQLRRRTAEIGAGLVLSGLGMGTIGGILMTRYFDISRGHAALIDVGGVVGVFVGIAIENVVTQAD